MVANDSLLNLDEIKKTAESNKKEANDWLKREGAMAVGFR